MAADDLGEKLGKFFSRFGQGKDQKIHAMDVARIVERLQQRVHELQQELDKEANPKKQTRLQAKLATAERMLERAKWLMTETNPAGQGDPAHVATEASHMPTTLPSQRD